MQQMIALGVDMAGRCCGTTPEYIADLVGKLDFTQYPQTQEKAEPEKNRLARGSSFYHNKEAEGGKKLIAVELAPPAGIDDEKLMDAAHLLQRSGVDVLTFGFSLRTYQSGFYSHGGKGSAGDRYVCHASYLLS